MDIFLIFLLGCALIISVIEDVRRFKIPNLVTFPTIILAIGYHTVSGGLNGLGFSLGGLALGIAIFMIPYILGGMGAGDVKLMGAAGAIFGPKGICIASALVILAGGVYGLILFIFHPGYTFSFLKRAGIAIKTFLIAGKLILSPPEKNEKPLVLRFAIPIALGTIFYTYLTITGSQLIQDFLGLQGVL